MNLDRHVGEHMKLFQHLVKGDGDSAVQHRKFYDEYLSVMDLPAEFYLQTVSTVFQQRALPSGTMKWQGQKVDPSAIRHTAMLTVEGELTISPLPARRGPRIRSSPACLRISVATTSRRASATTASSTAAAGVRRIPAARARLHPDLRHLRPLRSTGGTVGGRRVTSKHQRQGVSCRAPRSKPDRGARRVFGPACRPQVLGHRLNRTVIISTFLV